MNPTTEVPALSIAAPHPSLEELLAELLRLSSDKKREVIARLTQSLESAGAAPSAAAAAPALPDFVGALANDPKINALEAPAKSMLDFAGAWADMPGTDEEIITSIRNARVSTRSEVSLD